jgi:hypothetical protein
MIEHELAGVSGLHEINSPVLRQYNLKQGEAIYGQPATDAVIKEMKQLHDRATILPRYVSKLTSSGKPLRI